MNIALVLALLGATAGVVRHPGQRAAHRVDLHVCHPGQLAAHPVDVCCVVNVAVPADGRGEIVAELGDHGGGGFSDDGGTPFALDWNCRDS